jgi:hypothetical protein
VNRGELTSAVWKWAGRLVLAAGLAILAGGVTVYHLSPYFRTTERLLALSAAEPPIQTYKDAYLLLLHRRVTEHIDDPQYRVMIPMLLPALMREERGADFDRLLAAIPAAERNSAIYAQAIATSLQELAMTNRMDEMRKYRRVFAEGWGNDPEIALQLRNLDVALSVFDRFETLSQLAGQLTLTLTRRPLDDREAPLLRFQALVLTLPPLERDLSPALRNTLDTRALELLKFAVRAIPLRRGTLDQFGETIVRCTLVLRNPVYLNQAIDSSLLAISNDPARWPEWSRFAERLARAGDPNLHCVRDYVQGLLHFVVENDYSRAVNRLSDGVIRHAECGKTMQSSARALVAEIRRKQGLPPLTPPPRGH